MSRKFLAHINLAKNEIQNAVAQNLASAPGTPLPGQFYYNTTSGRFEFYGNSAVWIDPTARANHSGTQAAGTITGLATVATSGSAADLSGILPATSFNDTTHGSRAGGTLHAAVVAAGTAGFMTGADKSKLDGVAAGATANSSDAFLLARANHTGTQLAATISNFDTQVRINRLDQLATPTASVSFGNQLLTNVLTPVSATDAATKGYVDALANGTDWKVSVRAASVANVAVLSGLLTIDGITLVAGDRVLLKNQTVASDNGIYAAASGAWARSTDADASVEVTAGLAVMVTEGTTLADTQWVLTTNDTIVLGTTALAFAQIGAGTSYASGSGISIVGNVIAIDTAVVTRKFAATLGAGASIAVNHNLNTLDVNVQVYEIADGSTVECDVVRTSVNQITLGFAVAVTASAFRVVVQG